MKNSFRPFGQLPLTNPENGLCKPGEFLVSRSRTPQPVSRIFLSMFIRETELVALDFETTGTVPGFDTEPWQVGAVVFKNGIIDASQAFESFIRVDINRPFNAYAPGKHHKLRDEIAAAPEVSNVWKKLDEFIADRPIVAHNAATEKKILRKMAPMHRFGPWVDTLTLVRQAWPQSPSHRLEDLVAGIGLQKRILEVCPDRIAHDALYDAIACAALLEHLLKQSGWKNLSI